MEKVMNGQTFETAGADTSISEGTYFTANASANTKGSYTQLLSATTHPGGGLLILTGGANLSGNDYLIDIALGAAASEQIIVPNLHYFPPNDSAILSSFIPISIPEGSRISGRCQASVGSRQVRMNVIVMSGESVEGAATSYGIDTANSRGTSVTSSGSSNTKGSWTELTSATTATHSWCIVRARGQSSSQYIFDLGTGGSGSEQVCVPNLPIRDSSSGIPLGYAFPWRVPQGTRIAARVAAAGGTKTAYISLVMI